MGYRGGRNRRAAAFGRTRATAARQARGKPPLTKSTGIGRKSEKPVGQALGEFMEPDARTSRMAAELPMIENQRKRTGQQPDHRQHHQGGALVDGRVGWCRPARIQRIPGRSYRPTGNQRSLAGHRPRRLQLHPERLWLPLHRALQGKAGANAWSLSKHFFRSAPAFEKLFDESIVVCGKDIQRVALWDNAVEQFEKGAVRCE